MIRSLFMAAFLGLVVIDANFNFSCFVHNHGFCFLQVWCHAVFVSSGHHVLLNFGLRDTSSYEVLKKCATLILHHNCAVSLHLQTTITGSTKCVVTGRIFVMIVSDTSEKMSCDLHMAFFERQLSDLASGSNWCLLICL